MLQLEERVRTEDDDLVAARPVFVGDHPRRRRWLRAVSAACTVCCLGFFGAIAAGVTESPSVHHGGPSGQAHALNARVADAARGRAVPTAGR